MHIAASRPLAVSADDIEAEVVERERAVYREQVKEEGKPENLWERIVDGKMKRFFQENSLLEQPFVKNPDQTGGQLVAEATAKIGENIVVRRFTRYAIGE
jgi:elongation factor Ts